MVLRSERELLNANKEQEMKISQLKLLLEEKKNEEFSSDLVVQSPDDLFLKDLNPFLTTFSAKTKSKEFEAMGNDSTDYGSSACK
ncbi:hypothetical protein Dsin_016015 [Dipteronia sinensis]|uniref:Uncharacterized protein n=1 Tax=Dipteronia sinensis TaxID=43782 RepID=A0AAE0E581_9ROSI|nr:hypothetical protein Dsin_016015 [Dipteronia sinensis]